LSLICINNVFQVELQMNKMENQRILRKRKQQQLQMK